MIRIRINSYFYLDLRYWYSAYYYCVLLLWGHAVPADAVRSTYNLQLASSCTYCTKGEKSKLGAPGQPKDA